MNFFLLAVISSFWGSSFILMKWALPAFGPLSVGAFRVAGGALALLVLCGFIRPPWTFRPAAFLKMLPLVFFGYIYPFSTQPFLISRYDSGFVGMAVSLVPLMTIAVSVPMLKKLPNRYETLAVLGGLVFLGLIFKDGFQRDFKAIHLVLLASVPLSYATANTYVKRSFQEHHPLLLSALALSLAGFFLVPASLATEPIAFDPSTFYVAFVCVGVLGVFSTGVATFLFYLLIYRIGPLGAGMVGYIIPLIALTWGWIFGEVISPLQVIGLAGVLAMVALSQHKPRRTPNTGSRFRQG